MGCPVCNGASGEVFTSPHARVAKCAEARCGHLFALDPAPDQGVEDYEDFDRWLVEFRERNKRLVSFLTQRGAFRDGLRLLDFGCGPGHILRTIREIAPKTDITFIEANEDSAARMTALGFTRAGTLDEAKGPFDLILMIEVIEHVSDPRGLLRALAGRLAPAGHLFITTPCGEDRRGSRNFPSAYGEPAHVQFFTERSLELCCRLSGVDIQLEHIPAIRPPEAGFRGAVKSAGRRLRAKVSGDNHLTGLARAAAGAAG
jgi:SAM-dependent methyltransferase